MFSISARVKESWDLLSVRKRRPTGGTHLSQGFLVVQENDSQIILTDVNMVVCLIIVRSSLHII